MISITTAHKSVKLRRNAKMIEMVRYRKAYDWRNKKVTAWKIMQYNLNDLFY